MAENLVKKPRAIQSPPINSPHAAAAAQNAGEGNVNQVYLPAQ